jgi:RNA dependent RNA polymerase
MNMPLVLFTMAANTPQGIQLAALHSKAVDYVKTGEPAEMPKHLKPRRWPHFMEKKHKPKEQIYISNKILGQLYNQVETIDFMPRYEAPFDRRILNAYSLDPLLLKTTRQIKIEYDTAVRRIMAQQEIKTEFEVWTTFVLSRPRVGSDYKVQEDMAHITGSLKDRFKQVCIEKAGSAEFDKLGPFVAAMYQVTWEELEIALHECRTTITVGGREVPKRKMEPRHMPLISFPWLFYHVLGRIATGIDNHRAHEAFGLPLLPLTHKPDSRHGDTAGNTLPDFIDFIETAEGVTHRGEVLDLFRPDDIDSDGDEVEQPHTIRTQDKSKSCYEIEEIKQERLDCAKLMKVRDLETTNGTLELAIPTPAHFTEDHLLAPLCTDFIAPHGDQSHLLLGKLMPKAPSVNEGKGEQSDIHLESSGLHDMEELTPSEEVRGTNDNVPEGEAEIFLDDRIEMALEDELEMTLDDESPFDRLRRVVKS